MEATPESMTTSADLPEIAIEETSATYVARWNRLISTTNWEKGRIISQWRDALVTAGASPQEYSDEAWSRRLQAVTPQHVGRLRRVWERFGNVFTDYDRLFWSHFQAALDWDDAELWLEGAVQNGWSISSMRTQRSTAIQQATGQAPSDADVDASLDDPSAELGDSLADEADDMSEASADPVARETGDTAVRPSSGAMDELEGDSSSSEGGSGGGGSFGDAGDRDDDSEERAAAKPVRPFAGLAELPPDLSEAFEAFKLAILRYKIANWTEVDPGDVIDALDALKELATAPNE